MPDLAPKDDKNEHVIAYSVKIPTFEIDKWHSDVLLRAMKEEENHIVLKVTIELPHALGAHDKVHIELWYASIFDLEGALLEDLNYYTNQFKGQVTFAPRIFTFACTNCPEFVRKKQCISEGRYCFIPPVKHAYVPQLYYHINWHEREFSDLMDENLRQKCVHKIGEDLEKGNGATVWLMYMYNFYMECMHDKKYDTQTEWRVIKEEMRQCSVKVLEGLSIDPQNVHKCVIDSYENWYQGGVETDNKMLRDDSQLIRKTGFRLHPAVTINGAIYKGNLKCPDVFEAICSAFKSKADQPDYCSHNSDLAITMRTKKEFIDDIMKDI